MTQMRPLFCVVAVLVASLMALPASAQARRQKPKPKPVVVAAVAAPIPEQKCLRALNGACTNPVNVEIARQRALIIPAVRVSYFGTPAGSIGGRYIPFERFFQDNPIVFGLPTFTLVNPACCVTRTK